VMAVAGLLAVGPIVENIANAAGNVVQTLVNDNVLPLVSIVVEPAKVLFLNNAINHGVLAPLGVAQSVQTGKSILFMIETNPGPGLGILLAYLFFGPRALRPSAPGAIIIHFFGGIHEIYFPYVLMNPRLIIAAILGGGAGVFTAVVTNAGLVATPAPRQHLRLPRGDPQGRLLRRPARYPGRQRRVVRSSLDAARFRPRRTTGPGGCDDRRRARPADRANANWSVI